MAKYSKQDIYNYHSKRDMKPGAFNILFGDTLHSYSAGYIDGADGNRNNRRTIKIRYGNKSASSYSLGFAKGKKARR